MTRQAAHAAPTPTPYVFWLAAWHNLPIPLGQPCCCRITRAALEVATTDTICWSIPLSNIVACERHVQHDGIIGFYLYARLTVDTLDATTGVPGKQEIFLGAMDPLSQEWEWQETLNLIKLLNDLGQFASTSIHANPYYRALERRRQLSRFQQIASTWDALRPPADYQHHPLLPELCRQSTRLFGLPLLLGVLCVLLAALLFWLEAAHWPILTSTLSLLPFVLASVWSLDTYRRFPVIFSDSPNSFSQPLPLLKFSDGEIFHSHFTEGKLSCQHLLPVISIGFCGFCLPGSSVLP